MEPVEDITGDTILGPRQTSAPNLVFVNQTLLDAVDKRLPTLISEKNVRAILLVDRSGMILTYAGDPPLHPDQMAAVAAGIFGAMRTFIKATRSEEFLVHIPSNGTVLQFNQVDSTALIVGYYSDGDKGQNAADAIRQLADTARDIMTTEQTHDRRIETGDFIIDKLNEILK
jgi:predicted regulator of Ras-like GTPase activity (Roadblock/LC7/MglB family)